MSRTNLKWPQSAYRVTRYFPVFVRIGSCPANTWVGSLRACSTVWVETEAAPGDHIVNTHAGVFLVSQHADAWYEVEYVLSDKHFWEYQSRHVDWPLECLEEVDYEALKNSKPFQRYEKISFKSVEEVEVLGRMRWHGRMPDIVLETMVLPPYGLGVRHHSSKGDSLKEGQAV